MREQDAGAAGTRRSSASARALVAGGRGKRHEDLQARPLSVAGASRNHDSYDRSAGEQAIDGREVEAFLEPSASTGHLVHFFSKRTYHFDQPFANRRLGSHAGILNLHPRAGCPPIAARRQGRRRPVGTDGARQAKREA
jgi:hypothetical protein